MHKIILGTLALSLSLVFAALGSNFTGISLGGGQTAAAILHNLPGERDPELTFLDLDKVLGEATATIDSESTSTPEEAEESEETQDVPSTTIDPTLASVKIRCLQTTDKYKRLASGTGFLINSKGVIMTNAHVAQFLLLKNAKDAGKTECAATISKDDETSYSLGLLYISPSWLLKHASLIGSVTPKGTGESDFALAYITGRRDGQPATSVFPFLPPATSPLSKSVKGKEVTIVGYPRLEDKTTPQTIATTTITDIYTFGSGYADIFSLASSTLGHQGASGGPVIDEYGRAIGILTTKDPGTTILNAITMAHVDRGLQSEIGFDLASYLQGNLDYKAEIFNKTVSPILQEILAQNLAASDD